MQFRLTVYFKDVLLPLVKNFDALPAAHEAATAFCRSPKVSKVEMYVLVHTYRSSNPQQGSASER